MGKINTEFVVLKSKMYSLSAVVKKKKQSIKISLITQDMKNLLILCLIKNNGT